MTIRIKIESNYDIDSLLLYLKSTLIKKSISNVEIIDNKILLENKFFNQQSRMNSFAYVSKGTIFVESDVYPSYLIYNYHNFKLPLYICSLLMILYFIFRFSILICIVAIFMFTLNAVFMHFRQTFFFRKQMKTYLFTFKSSQNECK